MLEDVNLDLCMDMMEALDAPQARRLDHICAFTCVWGRICNMFVRTASEYISFFEYTNDMLAYKHHHVLVLPIICFLRLVTVCLSVHSVLF